MPGTSLRPVSQRATALMWLTPAQLEVLVNRVTEVRTAWARDWVLDSGAATRACTAVQAHEWPDRKGAVWSPLGSRGDVAGWIDVRTDPTELLFEAMFGADSLTDGRPSGKGEIAEALVLRGWNALTEALCAAIALDAMHGPSAPDPALLKPWSGGAILSLPFSGDVCISLLFNPACVGTAATSPGRRNAVAQRSAAGLVPLRQALASRVLPVRVELSACELDLGSLEGLRIGDVVPLPHRLDAPLRVATGSDVQLCAGFLGSHSGFKAIELAREPVGEHEIDHFSHSV